MEKKPFDKFSNKQLHLCEQCVWIDSLTFLSESPLASNQNDREIRSPLEVQTACCEGQTLTGYIIHLHSEHQGIVLLFQPFYHFTSIILNI